MQCPKCNSPMEPIELLSSLSQRCTQCKGLWLTMGENRLLKAEAERVDIGDAQVGEHYNHIDRIKCPVCFDRQLVTIGTQGTDTRRGERYAILLDFDLSGNANKHDSILIRPTANGSGVGRGRAAAASPRETPRRRED